MSESQEIAPLIPEMRFPVRVAVEGRRGLQGWLRWDETGERVEVKGRGSVPTIADLWFPGTDSEPSVTIKIKAQSNGRFTAATILIQEKPTAPEITLTHLTAVRKFLPEWLEYGFRTALRHGGSPNDPHKAAATAYAEVEREGRRRISEETLREAARIYTECFDHKPMEAVAHQMNISLATARKYIALCRSDEHQILNKASKGKKTL